MSRLTQVVAILASCAALPAGAADADQMTAGKRLFENCSICHTLGEDEDNGVGPNLWGVVGARAAGRKDFAYSAPLKGSNIVWTDAMLDRWLTAPATLVPGTKMAFVGLANAEDRQALLVYLKAGTTDK